jgi:hypothetical protein
LLALRLRVLEGIAELLVALALLRGALPESLELASRVGALRLQLPHSRRGIRGRVLVDGVEDGDERRLRGGGFGLDGVDRPYRVFVQAALLRRGAVLVLRVRARAVGFVRARALLVGAASSSASRRRLCPATTASPPASSKSLRRNGSLTSDVDGIGGEGSTLDAPVRLAMETMSSWSVFHSVATALRRDS